MKGTYMQEVWRDLIYRGVNYGDRLEVSTYGNLRNKKTGTVYKLVEDSHGYLGTVITLGNKKKYKKIFSHKAVADTFLLNPDNKSAINHIDGNKRNNHVDNLEWCTVQENNVHAVRNKLHNIYGTNNPNNKLSEKDILFIRKTYCPYSRQYGSRALAKKFNVAHQTILSIIKNKTWRNI